jgi:hypothetical protein
MDAIPFLSMSVAALSEKYAPFSESSNPKTKATGFSTR